MWQNAQHRQLFHHQKPDDMSGGSMWNQFIISVSAEELGSARASDAKLTPVIFEISFQTFTVSFLSYVTFKKQKTNVKQWQKNMQWGNQCADDFPVFESALQFEPALCSQRGVGLSLSIRVATHRTEPASVSALCCINYASSASNRTWNNMLRHQVGYYHSHI